MEDFDNELRVAIAVWDSGEDISRDLEVKLMEKGYDVQAIREHIKYLNVKYNPGGSNASERIEHR